MVAVPLGAIRDGHIVIPAEWTTAGSNQIEFEFIAGDEALNRNDEFLYTLFVPARARLAFPCFDQPDLKARYTPDAHRARRLAGGRQRSGRGRAGRGGRGATTFEFAETQPLPTYLFAFAAGKFSVETAQRGGRDAAHVPSRDRRRQGRAQPRRDLRSACVGARLARGLHRHPYPWGKFDVVLIPSFQFGGMEHAGAILYNASGLMLDESATQNQLLERASVIAHETAHMWFGDLVTMRWFNDVWMKEVFANFMAAKIVNPSFPDR